MAVILVVEDDFFIREYAESMILNWGHEIHSASDVPEALAHLHSSSRIDAVFTDVYLKAEILGGCDLVRQGLALRPGLRILYTTGNRASDALHTQFPAGTHFLPKPYTEDQLGASLRRMLAA